MLWLPRDLHMKVDKAWACDEICTSSASAPERTSDPLGKQQSAVPATRCAAPVSVKDVVCVLWCVKRCVRDVVVRDVV